jgi:hypothetical protein
MHLHPEELRLSMESPLPWIIWDHPNQVLGCLEFGEGVHFNYTSILAREKAGEFQSALAIIREEANWFLNR